MKDTPQSLGGRERARRLEPSRRREIASEAAKARWRSAGSQARQTAKQNRTKLHIGASRIREILIGMPEEQRADFLRIIWPTLTDRIARLIARYPGEVTVSGSHMTLPQSWTDEDLA